jgi:ParB-like chromosome segregation protein Spo0J
VELKIEMIPAAKLRVNPANPRTIGETEFRRLVKSLEDCPEMFEARPCLCSDRTGELVIVGGNMRYRAALELGYEKVPAIVLRGLTEEREREIAIKDNGAFGEFDWDALANEWSDLPLTDWGVDLPEDWMLPPPNFDPGTEDEQGRLDQKSPVVCPECGHEFTT